jgi:hypothetical protein
VRVNREVVMITAAAWEALVACGEVGPYCSLQGFREVLGGFSMDEHDYTSDVGNNCGRMKMENVIVFV